MLEICESKRHSSNQNLHSKEEGMILTRVNTSFEWRKLPSFIWLSTFSFSYYANKADSKELRKPIKAYVHCTETYRTEMERVELWVTGAYQKKCFWTTSNKARFVMVVRHNTDGRTAAEYCTMSSVKQVQQLLELSKYWLRGELIISLK